MIKKEHFLIAFITSSAAAFALAGYEFVRSSANTLFKANYGAQNLPFVMAVVPVAMWLVLWLYGKILSWVGPRRTLFLTTIASAVIIFICFLAVQTGVKGASAFLFVFREVYIVLLIEQYWSLLNSSLGEDSAKKLNGPICGWASLGSISGGLLLYALAERLGTEAMLLFAAVATLPAAFLSDFGYRKIGEPKPRTEEEKKETLGLKEFRLHPMLIFLFLIVIVTQIVSTTLDIRFQGILQEAIPEPDKQTAFSGGFFAWVNGVAAFLQFVAAPILLKYVPLRAIYFFIPLVHVATCFILTLNPSLASAGGAFLLFKAFDYSLFRASKEILYIPLSFAARYRAKEVVDAFGYRFGKGATSLVFVFFKQAGFIVTSAYSLVALAASLVWFGLIFPLTKLRQSRPI